jgi:hypothetical protein
LLTISFGVYLFWLFYQLGAFAWVVLAATNAVYVGLAALSFLTAVAVIRRPNRLWLLPYVPLYAAERLRAAAAAAARQS